ncbi:hypothetical protein M0812_12853 [Anaeramoeba flamelloides]|uniref:Uncharacterized protein n=1 Tax=Anaeramoeba flamelloides TaxID=1746091 RepID=A0AAV7ZJ53_9EUKA|nr:hypothetical protein M0812_12853 [Anaeramoeba flamelloides]
MKKTNATPNAPEKKKETIATIHDYNRNFEIKAKETTYDMHYAGNHLEFNSKRNIGQKHRPSADTNRPYITHQLESSSVTNCNTSKADTNSVNAVETIEEEEKKLNWGYLIIEDLVREDPKKFHEENQENKTK